MKKTLWFEFYLVLISAITGYFWFNQQSLNGIYALLALALIGLFVFKSILYPLSAICFIALIESSEGIIVTLPIYIYLAVGGLALVTLVVKKKKKQASLAWIGMLAVGISLITAGHSIAPFASLQTMVFIAIGILGLYYLIYFSLQENDQYKIASLIKWAGVLIVFQVGIYYFKDGDFLQLIQSKNLDIGWAKSNQVGIALLTTIPITLYCYFSQKGNYVLNALYFSTQVGTLILTYSRGAVLSGLLIVLIAFVSLLFLREKKWRIFFLFLIFGSCLGVAVYLARHNLHTIFDVTFRTGLDDSGRLALFKEAWLVFKQYPLFGEGFVLSGFGVQSIIYYHSTPLQFMATTGVIGLFGWLAHSVCKYYIVLKNRNLLAWFALLAFSGVGLYGLIDVTFFTFPYTLFLILLLLMIEKNHYTQKTQQLESSFFNEQE